MYRQSASLQYWFSGEEKAQIRIEYKANTYVNKLQGTFLVSEEKKYQAVRSYKVPD